MSTQNKKPVIFLAFANVRDDSVPYLRNLPDEQRQIREALEQARVAGLCDPSGRIFGLMPHPERHLHPTHHPRWTREGLKPEGDGVIIFRNAVNYIQENF